MHTLGLFLIAIGLAMDAFAVSVCKGLAMKLLSWKKALVIGVWFGGFQALMPLIGYFLGSAFQSYITAVDHWIAFILLTVVGVNMIRESRDGGEPTDDSVGFREMLTLAVATSIDAFAVGITFAVLPSVNIGVAVGLIGVITLVLSMAGVAAGHGFGAKYQGKAELAGGVILILMGLKILLEHLGAF